jgi:YHS domain-containing protein
VPTAGQSAPLITYSPYAAPDPRQLPQGAMPLGFDGYCPVSMRNSNLTKWVPGNPQYGVQHRGRTYWFAGPQEKEQFWADPDKYAPALSGLDPVLFVERHQQVPGSREHSIDYNNMFYMFASEASLQQFSANPERYAVGVREAMGIKAIRTIR